MKDYEIEILEEWDPMYGTFLFCALKYRKPFNSDALPVQRVGLPDSFAVYIGTAECFLSYFFEKYFNRNLSYNVAREMVSEDDPDYDSGTDADIPKHIDNVIDFYERFVARMRKMLQMNPDASVILFEGP